MRRAIIAAIACVVLVAALVTIVVGRSTANSCAYPAPVNTNLPAVLRSIGAFAQPLDSTNIEDMEQNAVTAATAVQSGLIGVSAQTPVAEQSRNGGANALEVALTRTTPNGDEVVGVVSYLEDCAGRAYFDKVDAVAGAPGGTFPVIGVAQARTRLGTAALQLVFSSDPVEPAWLDPVSGREVQAGS